ncbi:MAG: type II toxin-antitoxin system VapC family toxin [Rhodopseudomonas sp.]|uniref:type II toxin-antitoxin system VapC family toxin n=1 Tax=Rhodopseudomonas sp. TaxID=1078 RepID=UPI00180175F1|nr:type II toxin-antitoxin system VapC family toxin [Rhodopseudomonas sp.]NVN87073.1 type II toxin-antitoxin system VapC family toxin [Rhodopseudomonas sp.]
MIVIDASAIVALCLDERDLLADDQTFESLAEQQLLVPAHWHAEIGNAFVTNLRRGRLSNGQLAYAIENLAILQIVTQPVPRTEEIEATVTRAAKAGLTYYDELYVWLAESNTLPLFTFDKQMREAAQQRGVVVLPA